MCVFMKCLCGGRSFRRKGQESMLNIMAVIMLVSVVFLYFFFVTQNQKIESSKMIAKQQKYKYAEIALANMYYVDGAHSTVAGVIGESQRFGDESSDWMYQAGGARVDAMDVVRQYLDRTLPDYNYYFFVERDGVKSFELNSVPSDDVDVMVHRVVVPIADSRENAIAYLYVW